MDQDPGTGLDQGPAIEVVVTEGLGPGLVDLDQDIILANMADLDQDQNALAQDPGDLALVTVADLGPVTAVALALEIANDQDLGIANQNPPVIIEDTLAPNHALKDPGPDLDPSTRNEIPSLQDMMIKGKTRSPVTKIRLLMIKISLKSHHLPVAGPSLLGENPRAVHLLSVDPALPPVPVKQDLLLGNVLPLKNAVYPEEGAVLFRLGGALAVLFAVALNAAAHLRPRSAVSLQKVAEVDHQKVIAVALSKAVVVPQQIVPEALNRPVVDQLL